MPALRKSVSVVTLQPAVFLQPVQTNRQTKAEPLQPAVVHQVETEIKNRFFRKTYCEIAAFIWTYFDSISLFSILTIKKQDKGR